MALGGTKYRATSAPTRGSMEKSNRNPTLSGVTPGRPPTQGKYSREVDRVTAGSGPDKVSMEDAAEVVPPCRRAATTAHDGGPGQSHSRAERTLKAMIPGG